MVNQEESKRRIGNLLKRKAIAGSVKAVGGIGLPSKMPGTAYGISAHECGVGGKLALQEGSVCHNCYALRNNYTYPSVAKAHAARLASLQDLEAWMAHMDHIFAFLGAHLPSSERCHRWHDSGDVQDYMHLHAIALVAESNPLWRFWLPTKEYGILAHYLESWTLPSNLAVRVSTPYRKQAPNAAVRKLTGLTSTVDYNEGSQCPAPRQGGQCGACRACWDHTVANVNYKEH